MSPSTKSTWCFVGLWDPSIRFSSRMAATASRRRIPRLLDFSPSTKVRPATALAPLPSFSFVTLISPWSSRKSVALALAISERITMRAFADRMASSSRWRRSRASSSCILLSPTSMWAFLWAKVALYPAAMAARSTLLGSFSSSRHRARWRSVSFGFFMRLEWPRPGRYVNPWGRYPRASPLNPRTSPLRRFVRIIPVCGQVGFYSVTYHPVGFRPQVAPVPGPQTCPRLAWAPHQQQEGAPVPFQALDGVFQIVQASRASSHLWPLPLVDRLPCEGRTLCHNPQMASGSCASCAFSSPTDVTTGCCPPL